MSSIDRPRPTIWELHPVTLYESVFVTLGIGSEHYYQPVYDMVQGDYSQANTGYGAEVWGQFVVGACDTNMQNRGMVYNRTKIQTISVHIPLVVPSKYLAKHEPYEVTRQDVSEFVQGTTIETRVGVLRIGEPWRLATDAALFDEPVKTDGAKLIEDAIGTVSITRPLPFEIRPSDSFNVSVTVATSSGPLRPLLAIIALRGVEYRKVR